MNRAPRQPIPTKTAGLLTADGWILFGTRCARLFAYGLISVVLVLFLSAIGMDDGRIGLLLMLTLLGDSAASLWITTRADRWGRRRMLLLGSALMVLAAAVFATTTNFWLLLAAATIGVISPSGNEVGPFLSIEQAALSEIAPARSRTTIFAWYNLVGSLATATGALAGGLLAERLLLAGWSEADRYRPLICVYGAMGVVLALAFLRLTPAIETLHCDSKVHPAQFGLPHSRGVVLRLAGLFALDSFGGGFVLQTIVAYWFHVRFGADPAAIGGIFFGANILAGLSQLLAAWVSHRIGLLNTMVFTHLPSNILLFLVPWAPTQEWAVVVLWLRFSISQMDVPTRQSYTMAVVRPEERSAASGVTTVARTIGSAVSPALATQMIGAAAFASAPFMIAGVLKIVYDVILYRQFKRLRPDGESTG